MNHQLWVQSKTARPPKVITPELAQMRDKWYAQNPWRQDWTVITELQRGAFLCLRDNR